MTGVKSTSKIYNVKVILKLFINSIHAMLVKIFCLLTWRQKAKRLSLSKGLMLHLGCGEKHIPGMLNCDCRATRAVDLIMDCRRLSRFKNDSVNLIFANAFFEHLYVVQQQPLLQDCHRVLNDDGAVIFLGIPDFKIIADAYLNEKRGCFQKNFDLFEVSRYTHGDPEHVAGSMRFYFGQLHKAIFDRKYVESLLGKTGFKERRVFNYCYPREYLPLNIGLIAWKGKKTKEVKELLHPFAEYFQDIEEILKQT